MRWPLIISVILLSVVGCGPSGDSHVSAKQAPAKRPVPPADPVQLGRQVFEKYGCVMCHGKDAKSGIANPNAKTLDKVPPLTYVADGYTADELKKFIRRGQPTIDKKRADGPTPPFRMPAFAKWIPDDDLDAVQKYLFSLMPAGEKETF
jgi:mono/diheme cytochrome c family protein